MLKLRALLFDIDGTVYSNNLMHLHTIPVALANFAFMAKFAKARKYLHRASSDVDASGLSFVQFQAQTMANLLSIERDEALQKLNTFRAKWETIFNKVPAYKDFKPMVEHFRAKGLKTALLSDFPIGQKIERLKLQGLWDYELCTEDFGAIKPDSRSFLATAKLLGVEPSECLFVGNSHRFDVEGAKAAGMLAAHLKFGSAKKDSLADYTFYRYKDLQEWIERLLSDNARFNHLQKEV